VCKHLTGGAKTYFEDAQKVPYFVDGNLWCGYDDTSSLKTKVLVISVGYTSIDKTRTIVMIVVERRKNPTDISLILCL